MRPLDHPGHGPHDLLLLAAVLATAAGLSKITTFFSFGVAAAIVIENGFPILYRQERVGLRVLHHRPDAVGLRPHLAERLRAEGYDVVQAFDGPTAVDLAAAEVLPAAPPSQRGWHILGWTLVLAGLGVVGHQPLLKPGEQFEYTSGTALDTAQGSMHGEYFCVAEDGHRFEVKIPEFVLTLPSMLH